MATTEKYTRIDYNTIGEATANDLAARERLQDAIERAVETFHSEAPKTLLSFIEVYPCADCEECEAAA
jgi:hypothetical protein